MGKAGGSTGMGVPAALGTLVAGALLTLSLAPFEFWPLGLVSVAAFFYLLQITPGHGLLLGWLFGVGKYATGVWWVYVSIHEHGHAPMPLALFLTALFVGGLSLFSMVNGWLFCRFKQTSWMLSGAWFALVYTLGEWLLTWVLTGFPWLLVGYAHLQTPLAGFAPVGGVLLVGFFATGSAVAMLLLLRSARSGGWRALNLWLIAAAFLPWLVGGGLRTVTWSEAGEVRTAALIQGNIDQAEKWLPQNRQPIVAQYLALSEPHWGVDLLLWPEAAITLFEHEAQALLEQLDSRGKRAGTGLVLGIPALEVRPGKQIVFHNTAIGLGTWAIGAIGL